MTSADFPHALEFEWTKEVVSFMSDALTDLDVKLSDMSDVLDKVRNKQREKKDAGS